MKTRIITLLGAMGVALTTLAAVPATRLELPAGAHHPVLSPDGSRLLFSTDSHTGLSALDLDSGDITVLDEGASAGFQPVFSTDGSTVFYRTAELRDGLLYRDVRSYSFNEGRSRRLAAPTRDAVDMASYGRADFAVADYRRLRVRIDGVEKQLNPLPDSHSYLWASLSTDSKRLLFTEPFTGVYVSDPDGNNPVQLLDKGDFACWAGEHTVIAVVTHDDGYVVTDSKLVAVDTLTGTVEALTDADTIVGEATAGADGTVVYTDIEGNMFIFNLNDR